MLRKMNIATRLVVLISLMVLFVLIVMALFWNGFQQVNSRSISSTQNIMMEGERNKLQVSTHAMALAISDAINTLPDDEQRKEKIRSMVDQVRFEQDKSGYFFVYEGTLNIALPTQKERVGQDLGNTKDEEGNYYVRELDRAAKSGGGFVEYVFPKPGKGTQPKLSYAEMIPGTSYWIGTGVYIDNVNEAKASIREELMGLSRKVVIRISIGLLIVLVVVIIPFGLAIRRSIVVPVRYAIETANKVAKGDLNQTFRIDYDDEIGVLQRALKNMVEQLEGIVGNIIRSSEQIASASMQLSSTSQMMSQGANEQASSSEEVSSSMEQMVANIDQNTDNAKETEKIAESASVGIKEGTESANRAIGSMSQIADKISIINDIAFQTNILALNAAVEAARAGEHGRGFAVVAGEVRKLAERSREAAEEIDGLSKSSVDVSKVAGERLNAVMPEINRTAQLIKEISSASVEQRSGAEQVNNAIQQLSQVTQQNAASSEELATSSEQLASQADQLKDVIQFFQIKEQGDIRGRKHEKPVAKKTKSSNNKTEKMESANATQKTSNPTASTDKPVGFDIQLGGDNSFKDDEYEKY
ncbi:MAG: methyl-accepting chemotaxis protein [Bacteroidales bacterium]